MPRVGEGWLLIPIEALLRRPTRLDWSVRCGCILVDEPFTTIVYVKGRRIPVAIGSGSIICPPECSPETPIEAQRLAMPAWARGVTLAPEECPGAGDEDILSRISWYTGLVFERVEAPRVLEEGGVAAHPQLLDLDVVGGFCGVAEPMHVLHPLAALLATKPRLCVESLVEPLRGGRWWGGGPLAALRKGREKRILAFRYGVVRGPRPEALLLAAKPREGEELLLYAYVMGALHACGTVER